MKTIERNIFSVDAETNGLWGKSFALAAIVYNPQGEEIDRFLFRSDMQITDDWVIKNVIPALANVPVSGSRMEMLQKFAEFYKKYKDTSHVLYHMGHIVEAHLFRELVELGLIGMWDAPYVPIELSAYLAIADEKPDSPDAYIKKYNIGVSSYGTTHNPLYDCEVAGKAYFHLKNRN